jgi:hypothetical protein
MTQPQNAEHFLFPVSDTEAAWIAFPPLSVCPLEDRDDYLTDPPADVIASAPRVPLPRMTEES